MIFSCMDLAVPVEIMQHVVKVESSGNPYAIGVVNGRLQRQPKNLTEAVATARMLERQGYNFSVGIAQVNRYNLKKYGLYSYEQAFQVCPNLQAGTRILQECYNRARDWGKSFSCYYSGNFVTGYRHGYVQKVLTSMQNGTIRSPYRQQNANSIYLGMSKNQTVPKNTTVYKQPSEMYHATNKTHRTSNHHIATANAVSDPRQTSSQNIATARVERPAVVLQPNADSAFVF